MKFNEIAERLGGTIVVENPDGEITSAYTSDLLSDVMGHCGDESVLITIQNHLNAIAVCFSQREGERGKYGSNQNHLLCQQQGRKRKIHHLRKRRILYEHSG